MADEIKVTITGKDGVSKVFQEVSKSADSMQKAITKDASAAGTSLNKMSQDAQKASATTGKAFDDAAQASERAGRAFAVAGAALGTSLALFSRDIVTNQQNVANLTRTYGDAAGQLQAFAQQIQQSTTYSSEAAIESANIFGTLARNYGLSVDQIQQLIQVSTDLAATSGLTLQDVSTRVASAIRGEGEAAEALGLTMNQQAIDRNNLTLTMSNQEAAAFRLNALMEQTAFAEGAAGDKAKTTAGDIAQLNNKFQDMARGAIEAAGPLPDIVSGLTNIGAESGLAITGVVALAKGVRELSTAFKGLDGAGAGGGALKGITKVLGTGVAGEGLVASLGAVASGALAVTAAFTPLIATLVIAKRQADDTMATISSQTDAIEKWAKAIGDPDLHQNAIFFAQDIRDMDASVQDMNTDEVHDITDALDELLSLNIGDLAKLNEILAASGIVLGDLSNQALTVEQLDTIYNAILQVEKEHADYQAQQAEITQSHAQAVSDLTEQFGSLDTAVTESSSNFSKYWLVIHEGEIATRRAASGLNEMGDAAGVAADATGRMVPIIDGLGETASRTAADVHDLMSATVELGEMQQRVFGDGETVTRSFDAARPAVSGFNDALKSATATGDDFGVMLDGQQKKADDFAKQLEEAAKAVGLLDDASEQIAASGIKTPSLNLAVNTGGATEAVNGVYSAIVGATTKIGSQSQAIADWIGSITVGSDEAISKLEELRDKGQISEKTYRDAVSATNSVLQDNALIQEDLLRIQAKQAPIIADVVHQQAAYVDSLADMDTKQQTVALGYLDQAEAAKALSLAQLAASSTNETMQASTALMIQQAAAADPVLKAMLEDMHLLNENGTVNFDTNAEDMTKAIGDLTGAVQDLTDVIAQLPGIETSTNAKDTQGFVDDLHTAIDDIPDSSDTNITATDNATGTIAEVRRQLLALDGLTARTQIDNFMNNYTNNVVTTTSVGPGTGTTAGRLGGVMGYANGGMVTIQAAEVGAELARFANGGEAMLHTPGLYSVPVGTNILPAPGTKAEMSRRGGGGDTFNIQALTIVVQNGDIDAVLRSEALRQHRQR